MTFEIKEREKRMLSGGAWGKRTVYCELSAWPGSFSLPSSLQAFLQVKIIPTSLQGDVLNAQCGVNKLFYLRVLLKGAISLW